MGEMSDLCRSARHMAIETLIVDDHDDIRLLLRLVLGAEAGIEVTGEACNGLEAVDAYIDLQPNVIVLDEMMPGMRGLDVVRTLRDRGTSLESYFAPPTSTRTSGSRRASSASTVRVEERREWRDRRCSRTRSSLRVC